MIPTLLGMAIVVFTVMAASPGGVSAQALVEGQNLDPQVKKALEDYYNQRYGLDDPAPIQFLRWINNVSPVGLTTNDEGEYDGFSFFKGSDLGTSFRYGRPVSDLLSERVPITLLLNILSIPLIYAIAIAVGVRAALHRGGDFDRHSSVVMLALWSVPTMLAGVLMIGFLASNDYWKWFPTSGLSSREALDMPFLPHFQSLGDTSLFLFAFFAIVFTHIALSFWADRFKRTLVFTVLGFIVGLVMVLMVQSELPWWIYAVNIIAVTYLFKATAWMEYMALRVSLMATIGTVLGLVLGAVMISGDITQGFLFDRLWHLVLPVIAMAYGGFAFLAKLTRSSMLEQLNSQYVQTARAKGLPENEVLWRHVFRNALIPLITVSSSLLPGLLGGSIIIESIFSIDGMGKLAVEAVQARDRELVLSLTLISGLLTLFGYLVADLLYAWADPRVSYD